MEFVEVVRARRMTRRYDPGREVDHSTLTSLIELAGNAPSAGFSQGWDFVVLSSSQDRGDFWELSVAARATTRQPDEAGTNLRDGWLAGMRKAPVLILCLSDPGRYLDRYARPDKGRTDRNPLRWPAPYWDIDTGMAALLILLGAEDQGLGACFFGIEPDAATGLRERFGIPEEQRFVGVVSLGYPAPVAEPDGTHSPSDPARTRRGSPHRPARRHASDGSVPGYAHDGRYGNPWA